VALLTIPAMTYESVGGLETVLIRGGSLWSTSWSQEYEWVALLTIPAMTYVSVGGLETVLIRGGSLWSTGWSCELS